MLSLPLCLLVHLALVASSRVPDRLGTQHRTHRQHLCTSRHRKEQPPTQIWSIALWAWILSHMRLIDSPSIRFPSPFCYGSDLLDALELDGLNDGPAEARVQGQLGHGLTQRRHLDPTTHHATQLSQTPDSIVITTSLCGLPSIWKSRSPLLDWVRWRGCSPYLPVIVECPQGVEEQQCLLELLLGRRLEVVEPDHVIDTQHLHHAG